MSAGQELILVLNIEVSNAKNCSSSRSNGFEKNQGCGEGKGIIHKCIANGSKNQKISNFFMNNGQH